MTTPSGWHDLDAQLAAMPDAYAQCRDLGHSWAPHTVTAVDLGGPRRGYDQRVRCARCQTIRSRILDGAGRIIGGAAYTYGDGYLIAGHGRMTADDRAALRLHTLHLDGVDDLARRRRRAR